MADEEFEITIESKADRRRGRDGLPPVATAPALRASAVEPVLFESSGSNPPFKA